MLIYLSVSSGTMVILDCCIKSAFHSIIWQQMIWVVEVLYQNYPWYLGNSHEVCIKTETPKARAKWKWKSVIVSQCLTFVILIPSKYCTWKHHIWMCPPCLPWKWMNLLKLLPGLTFDSYACCLRPWEGWWRALGLNLLSHVCRSDNPCVLCIRSRRIITGKTLASKPLVFLASYISVELELAMVPSFPRQSKIHEGSTSLGMYSMGWYIVPNSSLSFHLFLVCDGGKSCLEKSEPQKGYHDAPRLRV